MEYADKIMLRFYEKGDFLMAGVRLAFFILALSCFLNHTAKCHEALAAQKPPAETRPALDEILGKTESRYAVSGFIARF